MQTTFLIQGGTVVDGTSAPPFAADVRISDGYIVEVGVNLARRARERVIDARDCYVTPGFFENHNHFDAPMWWMPTMEPLPSYGVTTSINGNCGFSAAPIHSDPAVRKEMVDIFSFFEDIPDKPFLKELPWDWKTWGEYKASMQRNLKLSVNFAAFVGHIALRLAVMGMDAWDRAATPDEIKQICALLEDALQAGALGMSSNMLDHDSKDRPVPSMQADDAEWAAIMDVLERHPGVSLQVIVDAVMRQTINASVERLTRLARGRKLRMQIAGGVPTLEHQIRLIPPLLAAHEARKTEGFDVWVGYNHTSPTITVNFISSLVFAQSNCYAWNEIVAAPTEDEKFTLLSDNEWRERARASWANIYPQSPLSKPASISLFESETFAGPTGVTLAEFMQQRSIEHPSDALADWLIDNGVRSILRLGDRLKDEATLLTLFRDPKALGNQSDAGAHGKMFCGIGDNVRLLTHYVRDTKLLKIEEAVHICTGQASEYFNMPDRGTIAVGKKADIAVFHLDEIEKRPDIRVFDVPDGEGGRTYRYSRAPAPMRLTMVNGVPTFDQGNFTGYFPGKHVSPMQETLAIAAE